MRRLLVGLLARSKRSWSIRISIDWIESSLNKKPSPRSAAEEGYAPFLRALELDQVARSVARLELGLGLGLARLATPGACSPLTCPPLGD